MKKPKRWVLGEGKVFPFESDGIRLSFDVCVKTGEMDKRVKRIIGKRVRLIVEEIK